MGKLPSAPRFAWLVPAVFVFGCSASNRTSGGLGGGGNDGLGGNGNGGSKLDGSGGFSAGSGGSPGCKQHCSADLHDLLDCNDKVLKTCPDSMGCNPDGKCVSPCDAANSNSSTFGCDFYSVLPEPELAAPGSCFAMLLANTWTTAIKITADHGGAPFDVSSIRIPHGSGASITYDPLPNGELPPGELGIVFLAGTNGGGGGLHINCPAGISPGITTDAGITKTGRGTAFHVTTSAPIAAYDIYPYGGAASAISSATLLIPTPAWGTNYIAADPYQEDPSLAFDNGLPAIQIVAAEDNTTVTIDPVTALTGGTNVTPSPANTPAKYTLNRGEVLQLAEDAELAGSPIESDKPVSVWGTIGCMYVPLGTGACDAAHQELLPVKALGNEYVAARYRDRSASVHESVPWTIVGAVDGTTLTYDPAPPNMAPMTIGKGEVKRFDASDPFSLKSQDDMHPFYVAGHMTGCETVTGDSTCPGDPEFVSTIPPAQWLGYYLFLTDPTYPNTHLVFIRKKNRSGTFDDVNLDCAGTLSGWTPVGTGGAYEVARVDLVIDSAPQGMCTSGVHTAKSSTPFGLTVWGWGYAVSYAYPAGMSTQAINKVVVPVVPK